MRNFQNLDIVQIDESTGVLFLSSEKDTGTRPRLAMRREGSYVAISVSYGPLEIALRPRFSELSRVLARLRPVEGLQTTRQVGTGQAYISLGLQGDGSLVLRPTMVADATGHMCFNLLLGDDVRQQLYDWLPAKADHPDLMI